MRRRKETGQALIFAALGMTVLLGFVGLAIDMGFLRYEKRLQQTAADAAAVAGASNLAAGSGITLGAKNASTANGFTDNGGGLVANCGKTAAIGTICVEVDNPPLDGPHAGVSTYVEVRVAAVQPTFFMKALGTSRQPVTARAVATNISGTTSDCLYLLGNTSGLTGTGGGNKGGVIAPSCGIVINGSINTPGHFPVCAATIAVAGSGSGGGTVGSCSAGSPGSGPTCNNQTVATCPAPIPAAANPLAYLTVPAQPAPASCSSNCYNPGTYTSGITVTGNSTVTLNPGIYVLNGGGFTCHGNPTITGNGVFIYLENGATFDCSGNASVTLTAPSASNCPACPSQFDGILMYQDPVTDQNADTLDGGGNSYPDEGYFGRVVIWGLTVHGNDLAFFGGNAGLGSSIVTNAILVE